MAPNTNLSTKNGMKPVENMTVEELRARQPGYFKDVAIGAYRLTQAATFNRGSKTKTILRGSKM